MEILVINEDGIPNPIKNFCKEHHTTIHYARGPLSIDRKLQSNKIKKVLLIDHDRFNVLFFDICQILNKYDIEVFFYKTPNISDDKLKHLNNPYFFLAAIEDLPSYIKDTTANNHIEKSTAQQSGDELDFRNILKTNKKLGKVDTRSNILQTEADALNTDERGAFKVDLQNKNDSTPTMWQRIFGPKA